MLESHLNDLCTTYICRTQSKAIFDYFRENGILHHNEEARCYKMTQKDTFLADIWKN